MLQIAFGAALAAIAKVFFDATGVRLGRVPMNPQEVREASARAGLKKPGP
jgi:CO/xanthine dehydrogenase Mo-binding subunit